MKESSAWAGREGIQISLYEQLFSISAFETDIFITLSNAVTYRVVQGMICNCVSTSTFLALLMAP